MHTYEIDLQWSGDRKGVLHSPVLPEDIEVATPPEFKGGMPGIWSPEHLYVAAVNSCLMTTFLAIAENSKFEFLRFESNAVGNVDKVDGKYLVTEITLRPKVTIPYGQSTDRAIRLLEKSEQACIISGSIRTQIHLDPEVIVANE